MTYGDKLKDYMYFYFEDRGTTIRDISIATGIRPDIISGIINNFIKPPTRKDLLTQINICIGVPFNKQEEMIHLSLFSTIQTDYAEIKDYFLCDDDTINEIRLLINELY